MLWTSRNPAGQVATSGYSLSSRRKKDAAITKALSRTNQVDGFRYVGEVPWRRCKATSGTNYFGMLDDRRHTTS
eukprot:1782722-Pyramimonas_sp.AAC.1